MRPRAFRPSLNRIPPALSHLLATPLAFFTPQSGGSPNADSIDNLYKLTLYVALVIFVLVEGALGYAPVRFRARKGAVAAQIRGNTRLEVGWTVGAAVILLALAVLTFAKLSSIQDPVNSGPEGSTLVSDHGARAYASMDAQAATEREVAENHRGGQAVRVAVRLPRRERSRRTGSPLLLSGDGRPHEHHRDARHRLG